MTYTPQFGYVGPGEFWKSQSGRLVIYRHCDSVFELLADGVQVMPRGRFDSILSYALAEFESEIWPE